MKFSTAAVLAAATAVSAGYAGSNVTYVTEIVEEYVTYCPGPTTITHGDQEYTVTEATTLTITDCPCTVTKPAIVSSVVECHDCPEVPAPSEPPVEEYPQPPPPPPQDNSTIPSEAPAPPPEEGEEGDQGEGEEEPPTAGAAQAAVLSGAGLAGVLGLAAFIL